MRLNSSGLKHFATLFACAALFVGCASLLSGGEKSPFIGTWDLTVESPLGTNYHQLSVNDDFSGTILTEDSDAGLPIKNVIVEENNVSFEIVFNYQGEDLPAKFVGVMTGDVIFGEYSSYVGNASVTAKRI